MGNVNLLCNNTIKNVFKHASNCILLLQYKPTFSLVITSFTLDTITAV